MRAAAALLGVAAGRVGRARPRARSVRRRPPDAVPHGPSRGGAGGRGVVASAKGPVPRLASRVAQAGRGRDRRVYRCRALADVAEDGP